MLVGVLGLGIVATVGLRLGLRGRLGIALFCSAQLDTVFEVAEEGFQKKSLHREFFLKSAFKRKSF
jgi:hypothetical protein